MIKVKHPNEAFNISQNEFLASLNEEEKHKHALMFCYGNAVFKYHALNLEPTIEDFNEWIDGLDEPFKKGMKDLGFEKCTGVLSFTRYVREKNNIGMEDYLKFQMGADYFEYREMLSQNKSS